MSRKTIDNVVSAAGVIVAIVLLAAGGLYSELYGLQSTTLDENLPAPSLT